MPFSDNPSLTFPMFFSQNASNAAMKFGSKIGLENWLRKLATKFGHKIRARKSATKTGREDTT